MQNAKKPVDFTALLFIEKGAAVNARDAYEETVLHSAACGDDVTLARILLQHGANVHAVNEQGHTPLSHACFQLSVNCDMLRLLLRAGAHIQLHCIGWAARRQSVAAVRLLIAVAKARSQSWPQSEVVAMIVQTVSAMCPPKTKQAAPHVSSKAASVSHVNVNQVCFPVLANLCSDIQSCAVQVEERASEMPLPNVCHNCCVLHWTFNANAAQCRRKSMRGCLISSRTIAFWTF